MTWEVIQGEAIETMRDIPDGSIDACITDPPYGTTACSWDSVIPLAPMWAALKRVVKKNGAIVLFGSQPFTSALVMSNPQMFRYEWVWDKISRPNNFLRCHKEPMRLHENIVVFCDGETTFNPQMIQGEPYERRNIRGPNLVAGKTSGTPPVVRNTTSNGERYPRAIIETARDFVKTHPTQKPVELMRYLVRTYTNEGDNVLDFTCGSGSTGVACAIEKRNFIGIESDPHYVEVSRARISRATGVHAEIPRRQIVEKELPLFAA